MADAVIVHVEEVVGGARNHSIEPWEPAFVASLIQQLAIQSNEASRLRHKEPFDQMAGIRGSSLEYHQEYRWWKTILKLNVVQK